MTTERRESARAPMDASVLFTLDGRQWRESRSKDISLSGIFLMSNTPVEPGQVIRMRFQLPNLKHVDPIKAQGEVMRRMIRKGRQFGFGLRFLPLSINQYEVLTDFVMRVLGINRSDDFPSIGTIPGGPAPAFTIDRIARAAAAQAQTAPSRSIPAPASYEGPDAWLWITRGLVLTAGVAVVFACYHITVWLLDLAISFTRLL